MNRKRPLLAAVVLITCLLTFLLFAWLQRTKTDAPFSISFISTTGSVPGSGHHGRHGIFAVTNRSNFAVVLPEFCMWSYKDGNQSRAWQEYFGTNGMRVLQPNKGCFLTFGEATNGPCRLELAWIPAKLTYWMKIPSSLVMRFPSLGLRLRYQPTDWLNDPKLIDDQL